MCPSLGEGVEMLLVQAGQRCLDTCWQPVQQVPHNVFRGEGVVVVCEHAATRADKLACAPAKHKAGSLRRGQMAKVSQRLDDEGTGYLSTAYATIISGQDNSAGLLEHIP